MQNRVGSERKGERNKIKSMDKRSKREGRKKREKMEKMRKGEFI